MASAAADLSSVADELGIDRLAVMGHSGGGAHALACGALLPERVLGVVSVSGLAPFGTEGLEWFAGMAPSGAAELRAAGDAQRRRTIWTPPSLTQRCSPLQTMPRSLGRGLG